MARVSFLQTSFLGGLWSPTAQGRMQDQAYKTALNECLNSFPLEEGSWTRRPGFLWLGYPKGGANAVLRAFDFSITTPYQMEFTDSHLRFWVGQSLVTSDDTTPYISTITTDSPAKVIMAGDVPAGWANGDTVMFTQENVPCSAPYLCNRQFTIGAVDATSFTLSDALTGDPVDGADIAYTPGDHLDIVRKVFELVTPYTDAQLSAIRTVSDDTTVTVLHHAHQPRVLSADASPNPFKIDAQDFSDGPWLDLNDTTTTLALSAAGAAGTTVTVTASATTGINGGDGFKSTDVARLIRFQGGPAQWQIGTTYAKNAKVTGSDGNIFTSLVGVNIGNDPISDDGTHWQLSATTVIWTWLKIVTYVDPTHVTATIEGANPEQIAATTAWRLGAFSDTTGWPSCGVYHEGRLWLTGQASNRVDGSVSDDHFNFSPTDTDGTVADSNAIAAIANATDVNDFFWMISGENGILLGSQAGEWLVRASELNDPISPSSIQMHRVTTYGCANVEPQFCTRTTAFVQRQQRRILDIANYPYGEAAGWYADNLDHLASSLTGHGIAEMRYQQTPTWNLWMRRNDGVLIGSVFRHSAYGKESFNGWHRHLHGDGRTFSSISTGPAFGGLSETLYAVTNQPDSDAPDYNVRWVEALSPQFDDSADDCDANFLDGSILPCCIETYGSGPDGINCFGLSHLEGKSVTAFLGGLDLGTFTVADGTIQIQFSGTFTWAFFQALATCDTGGIASRMQSTSAASPYAGGLCAFVGSGSPVGYNALGGVACSDEYQRVYEAQPAPSSGDPGIMKFDALPDGSELAQATNTDMGITITASDIAAADGYVYTDVASTHNLVQIDASDLSYVATGPVEPGTLSSIAAGGGFVAYGVLNSSTFKAFAKTDLTTPVFSTAILTENTAYVCFGRGAEYASFYVLGRNYVNGNSDEATLYELWLPTGVALRPIVTLHPADIDATWTTWSLRGPAYDAADGNIVLFATTTDSVTTKSYLLKVSVTSGAILWKTGVDGTNAANIDLTKCKLHGTLCYFTRELLGTSYITAMDLSDGSTAQDSLWNRGLSLDTTQWFDYRSATVFMGSGYSAGSGPTPTYLGTYLAAHSNAYADYRWGGIVAGSSGAFLQSVTVTQYPVYGGVGFTYTSQGQLLRPDFGQDAGTQAGPAFGKMRRVHKAAIALVRTQDIQIGTSFDHLRDVPLETPGGTATSPPTLYSGTVPAKNLEIDDTYGTDSQLAWECDGPYPATVTAIAGMIQTQDE